MITATGGTPSATMTAILISSESRISIGWKRTPVRDVDVEIGVVHAVQPPQHRHVMEHDVLGVDREIERQEAEPAPRPRAARAR